MQPSVITGLGIVTALGDGLSENLAAAKAGTVGIAPFDPEWGRGAPPAACAAQILDDRWEPDLGERGAAMDRGTRLGLSAMEQALNHAGLSTAGLDGVGIVAGAAGPSSALYSALAPRMRDESWRTASRGSQAPNLCGHALAGLAGLRFGATGPNAGISAACASGSLAIAMADDMVRLGRAQIVLAGAADSFLTELALGSFAKAGAISTESDPLSACLPFDRRRGGLVFGEGAAFVVVEDRAHAERRGAPVVAEILGSASANDGRHMWAPDPDRWAMTIAAALRRAEVAPNEIALVSAHAPGTVFGDLAESSALRMVLESEAGHIPVTSTKGMHGHAMGASPSIEIVLSIAAMQERRALPTVGCGDQDPDIDLRVTSGGEPIHGDVLLKTAFGFMGTHTVLAFRVPPAP